MIVHCLRDSELPVRMEAAKAIGQLVLSEDGIYTYY